MPVASANADPEIHCIPGRCRSAPNNTEHRKNIETDTKRPPDLLPLNPSHVQRPARSLGPNAPNSKIEPTAALFPHRSPDKPTRLPPSEVCQRGPRHPGRQRRAAARIEKPSGQRSFAATAKQVGFGRETRLLHCLNSRVSLSTSMTAFRREAASLVHSWYP